MVSRRKIFGVAVVLGVVLGAAIAISRMPKRAAAAPRESVPTNAAVRVVATNAVVREVEKRGGGGQRRDANSIVQLPTPNLTSNHPPVKVRVPIGNDPKIPKARQVLLANRRIAVPTGRSFPKKFCSAQTPTARGTAPYVVISELPVSRDVRIQAVANGAKVVGFLPNNALLVEADAQALKNLEEDVLFVAAVEYEPSDKVQWALAKGESAGEKGGETVEATVVLLNPQDREGVMKFITDHGGEALGGRPETDKSLGAKMPRELVGQLAGKAEVRWIERRIQLKALNNVAVQPGLMNVTPVWNDCGLTGEGQIISTSDSGIDTGDVTTLHKDLRSAVIGLRAVDSDCHTEDRNGHGTHTAGSIVGNGANSSGRIRGTAYGAKLWAWGIADEDEELRLPETYDALFRPDGIDAHIHSASWGYDESYIEDYGGVYTKDCGDVDAYAWDHADFLPVFAAGNAGNRQTTNSVMPFATAKNVLAVGASVNTAADAAQIADFSSRGPCEDGRIKPDVVSPGYSVYSTRTASSGEGKTGDAKYYTSMSGTSMATPLTAGAAALVREWMVKRRGLANPSAALVKAVLAGGATGGAVPDKDFGWGRVDVGASIAPAGGRGVFMADRLPFAATSNFTFRVTTTNAAPLDVQLVWVDYPMLTGAGKTLVNDLDLRVSATTNGVRAVWLGNGGTEPDDLNNAEAVRVGHAPAATYTVRVACTDVPYAHDDLDEGGGAAAIYIRGAFDPKDVACDVRPGMIWLVR